MEQYNHVLEIVKKLGYIDLLPLQKKAFCMPELYDPSKNIFITGNTSSGKTLIPLLHYILEREKNPEYKMLFLVPYRALAAQKKMEIEALLKESKEGKKGIFPDLKVSVSTGELREDDESIKNGESDIAVIIYEKAFHFACGIPDFLKRYHTIVYDEFALSEDAQRGVACDLMLLLGMSSPCRLFALATPHYSWRDYIDAGKFTHVYLCEIENRVIVPLTETPIFLDRYKGCGTIAKFHDINGESLDIQGIRESGTKDDLIEDLCVYHMRQGHRILVFMNNCQEVRRMARELSKRIKDTHPELLPLPKRFENKDRCFEAILDSTGLLEEDLINLMDPDECASFMRGIAYHSSWLGHELRTLVEKELLTDNGKLRVVFSTETMAYGINSSVDVVIVADMHKRLRVRTLCRRQEGGQWKVRSTSVEETYFLKVNEYQNYIGRAGRYGRSDRGYAYALMTQKPNGNNIRRTWRRLQQQRNDPPCAKSTLFRMDTYCNTECKKKELCDRDFHKRCNLYANEFAMPILGLIPPGRGITRNEIRKKLIVLPGVRNSSDWLDRILDSALNRLVYPSKYCKEDEKFVRFEGKGQTRQYYLTKSGQAVRGMMVTMFECHSIRSFLLGKNIHPGPRTGTTKQPAEQPAPKDILKQMKHDPFDLFYALCSLPELQRIAEDFFALKDPNSVQGRKQLTIYNELCTKKLTEYIRQKCITNSLYDDLTYVDSTYPLSRERGRRNYNIKKPFDAYHLLLAILVYEWYCKASVDSIDRDMNALGEVVIVTPGRMSRLTEQTSFYLQVAAAFCDTLVAREYEDIKSILLEMELCLYFGIRKKDATVIDTETLRKLSRQEQLMVSRILDYCSNSPPEPIREKLTKRQLRDWRQIVHNMQSFYAVGTISEQLKEKYPILSRAEKELTEQ